MIALGVEVLYDDRDESPGVKFNDADLIGLPLRITVSERSLQNGGVEFKRRDSEERLIVPIAETVTQASNIIKSMESEIANKVVEVEFRE
jgi:prolyl-tRNA synthetase